MQKTKNIKIFIGTIYLILLFIFLYLFFSKFSLEEITTYKFIQANREYLANIKQTNTILISFAFLIFTIIWVLILGFASPILLAAGFIFGKWLGVLLVVSSMTIGATLLYIFGNYFFKDLIREKFLNRFKNLEKRFKKKELTYMIIYRVIGGIPFQLSNLIPCMFSVRAKNFFIGSIIGMIPQAFIFSSLGAGLENQIRKNIEPPSIIELITSFEIYAPILGFVFLLIFIFVIKNLFYKN